jgi:hypothetical protein
MIVMPGLVAIQGNIDFGTGKLEDVLDPFNRSVSLALASGITSIYISQNKYLNPDGVIKATYGDLDSMLVKKSVLFDLSDFNSSDAPWLNRTNVLMSLRQAQAYLQDLAQYNRVKDKDKKTKEPKIPKGASRYLPLLKRETVGIIQAITAGDILAALELVDEFGIRIILSDAIEAWTVAEEIAKRRVDVIVAPRRNRLPEERISLPSGSSHEIAAILKRAGVKFAITPTGVSFGDIGYDLLTLPLDAAFAVQGGLDEQTALEAITITPAELLGVADRIGSLQPGKDADIIILDGHPLHYNTFVQTALINGKVLYEKKKSPYFSHIEH